MANQGIVHLYVRISHSPELLREYRAAIEQTNARSAFWEPFRDPKNDSWSVCYMEHALKTRFPVQLQTFLSEVIATPVAGAAITKPVIAVVDLRYSSLDVGLHFEPLAQLTEGFDNHFPYFQTFLQTYVPLAFQKAVMDVPHTSMADWLDLIAKLEFSYDETPLLAEAFAKTVAPTKAASVANWTPEQKARWTWVAANTSLVVPTLLAAVYLYWAAQDTRERYTVLERNGQTLIQRQGELIDSCYRILSSESERKFKDAEDHAAQPGAPADPRP